MHLRQPLETVHSDGPKGGNYQLQSPIFGR